MSGPRPLTYVLPLRRRCVPEPGELAELAEYLEEIKRLAGEVLVVDGSPPAVFDALGRALPTGVVHIAPDRGRNSAMGKVDGVMSGIDRARYGHVVIADDDVRHDGRSLDRIDSLLADHDLVRPQNYFDPLPWHALWDTSRTLLNRLAGGDWPGTLGVRRDLVRAAGGYDGDVMFENLELERTVRAMQGSVCVAMDCFVKRRPPTVRQFATQRVRQAYDELARPSHLLPQLLILPALVASLRRRKAALLAVSAVAVAAAEAGRRRRAGAAHFPMRASLFAPLWLVERGICVWLAVGSQLVWGGIRYGGGVVPRPATPQRVLDSRLRSPA